MLFIRTVLARLVSGAKDFQLFLDGLHLLFEVAHHVGSLLALICELISAILLNENYFTFLANLAEALLLCCCGSRPTVSDLCAPLCIDVKRI